MGVIIIVVVLKASMEWVWHSRGWRYLFTTPVGKRSSRTSCDFVMVYVLDDSFDYPCAGTLITGRYVLTTAQCVEKNNL